ncbi:MAG: ribonuclease J [Patescibacteria group bacterium]|nr:ribonuclease J [Patescibacteria group bacterium]
MNKTKSNNKKPRKRVKHGYSKNKSSKKSLRVVTLGGLESVGMNMTVLEYGDDIIVLDCGLMFPDEAMLGVDYVIPDTTYLKKNKKKLRGIIISHGHEDHIGAIPHIVPELGVPVFAGTLAKALIEARLEEYSNVKAVKLNTYKEKDELKLGVFRIKFFQVNHSIPDAYGMLIYTPVGLVVFTGDFRIDHDSPDGVITNFPKIAEAVKKDPCILLLSESTNAEIPGRTISEQEISDTFDQIFAKTKGRLIISSFASRIDRMQYAISSAVKHGRKVALSGRSMVKYFEAASKLGFIKYPKNLLIPIKQIKKYPDEALVILSTGSQGQQGSSLARMAFNEHSQVKIKPGDTVVLSASPIPGNEKSVGAIRNNLTRAGAEIIHYKNMQVHVTGHAYKEELREMLEVVKPKYLIPIHGEYFMRDAHRKLALEAGIPKDNILLIDDGDVVEVDKHGIKKLAQSIPSGLINVDGLGVGDVGEIVLRDRQTMAQEGMVVVIVTLEAKTGKVINSPDIISRGFVYMRENQELVNKLRSQAKNILSGKKGKTSPDSRSNAKEKIREELGKFIYKETKRRPMIIPVVLEV